MSELKEKLHHHCKEQLGTKIKEIEAAIADRREAISNETKSSMGDKYETTREMLQQDINMNMQRLQKVKADLEVLNGISTTAYSKKIGLGSLVKTNRGNYYIAVSLGKIKVDEEAFFVISSSSPIGKELIGKALNDSFSFNNVHDNVAQIL